ncbi:conserved Plasmodium protein, unknown function [Plasmodium ovale wallikeri]|uniref:Peptidase n=1 Tax=Plasmodium ovale wallikeri TaxID=864142 RepID=A0A1A8YG30_PLAOA|nr:conserved Plasmodium protein, unknown function [Plasmodium ovale wallikeri]
MCEGCNCLCECFLTGGNSSPASVKMKSLNYLFGRVTDAYARVESIKDLFVQSRVNRYIKETNTIRKFANKYKMRIEKHSNKIKSDVHTFLRDSYPTFEENIDNDLIFVNSHIYFEIRRENCLMICRKKIKRNVNPSLLFCLSNKSIDDLKKDKIVCTWKTELIASFPIDVNVTCLKIWGNTLFTFIIERNNSHVNLCCTYKGTIPFEDVNVNKIYPNHFTNNFFSSDVIPTKTRKRGRPLFEEKKKVHVHRYARGSKSCKTTPVIPQRCIFFREGIRNVEHLKREGRGDFLTTEVDQKQRCSRLFLNYSQFYRKLIYEEKKEEYFLNMYRSKDQKKIFLLSGSHIHNKLFLIHVKGKKKNRMYQLMLIRLLCHTIPWGKTILENYIHHIVIISKKSDSIDVYCLMRSKLDYLLKKNIYTTGKKQIFQFPTHAVIFLKKQMNISNSVNRLITLKDCICHDFDMTKHGLVFYLYRYFLKPYVCITYLFRKGLTSLRNGRNESSKRKDIYKGEKIIAKMKMVYLPIMKGNIQAGINNHFESDYVNMFISNTFINNVKLVLNVRKGIITWSKNVHNEQNLNSHFRAKNKILYDVEFEHLFEKNKIFAIKDVFINIAKGKKIPATFIYKKVHNSNIYYTYEEGYKTFSQQVNEECINTINTGNKDTSQNIFCRDLPTYENDLPLFLHPSKAIINVYPFYGEMNICTYTDEQYFYLLNNFVVVYFHLTGSGGICMNKNVSKKKGYEKINALQELMDCINFLKYKNISHTENMSIHLHSNAGLLGGYVLNHARTIVQNVVFVNPMMDLFNSLTQMHHPHALSERLEFGLFGKVTPLQAKGGKEANADAAEAADAADAADTADAADAADTADAADAADAADTADAANAANAAGSADRGIPLVWPARKRGNQPERRSRSREKLQRGGLLRMDKCNVTRDSMLLLYAICPYYNITAMHTEEYTSDPNKRISFRSCLPEENDFIFKNTILLCLNKNDIVCPNYNSIKYFLKYIDYKKTQIKHYLYVSHKDWVTTQKGPTNFLTYNQVQYPKSYNQFYISFSETGGHGGFNDYSSHINRMMGKIYFALFSKQL